MVKLRSGRIYIDENLFNYKIEYINYLIKNKYLSIYQNEVENFYHEIKKLEKKTQIKIQKNSKYLEYYGKKIYLNSLNIDNLNNYRLNLYENIWIKISNLILYYKKLKKKKYIKNDNLYCLICYCLIKKKEKLNICNNNNKKHIFHNYCFKESLNYSSPYHFINLDVFKNCPYCNIKGINENDIYIAY